MLFTAFDYVFLSSFKYFMDSSSESFSFFLASQQLMNFQLGLFVTWNFEEKLKTEKNFFPYVFFLSQALFRPLQFKNILKIKEDKELLFNRKTLRWTLAAL